MSSQEIPTLVTEEKGASGLDIALSDIRTYIAGVIEATPEDERKSAGFVTAIKNTHQERLLQWQKLKVVMGKEEFARIGYCGDCAEDADIALRKDIATKCARHSE
jgi:hypothetical protein